jgi:SulP family sulfate permease
MAVTISIVGGRPAMISAATCAVALVIAPLVREHGLDYLVATVILAGVLQIALSLLGVAKLMPGKASPTSSPVSSAAWAPAR